MALTMKSLELMIHLSSFRFDLWWNKKTSSSLNILIPAYPVILYMMTLGLIFPFVNLNYHLKELS